MDGANMPSALTGLLAGRGQDRDRPIEARDGSCDRTRPPRPYPSFSWRSLPWRAAPILSPIVQDIWGGRLGLIPLFGKTVSGANLPTQEGGYGRRSPHASPRNLSRMRRTKSGLTGSRSVLLNT